MNYIGVQIDSKYLQVGGIGHIMNDVFSGYIIGQLFDNVTYVHYPILSLNDDYHRDSHPQKYENQEYHHSKTDWETFFKFGEGELSWDDIADTVKDVVHINKVRAFTTIPISRLRDLLTSHENTLFLLTNNNRIYLNELYVYDHALYNHVYDQLYDKFKHLSNRGEHNQKVVTIHIRRGDWDWQPLSYTKKILELVLSQTHLLTPPPIIQVYAIGTESQLEEIKKMLGDHFSSVNIQFKLNENIFDTILAFYNSDILVGGHSCFPKMVAMVSRNLFFYLPFNDGRTQVLGGGVTGGTGHWGTAPEQIDPTRWIMTDVDCQTNRPLLIQKIKEILN